MIQKFDRCDRQFLSLPAVHPCEGIFPTTLLLSLISLCSTVCSYQSKCFTTQRKNAKEAIRQVGILLVLFEDVRDQQLVLSDSIILCFTELHLTFQKTKYLLEDCCREGARLWCLMKSEFIAAQFRVLIRAIATALDVLPLNMIDVSCEVKELVELVAKQARKANIELDPRDEYSMKRVHLILNYFEKGIEPDQGVIKTVLDHLEIRSWSDCQKEIKFLEDEINFNYSECNEREVPILSSLVGFMCYCRGVIFETPEYRHIDQAEVRNNIEPLCCLSIEDFRCPISLELMTDPVTASTGQTYDRSSIEKWLKAGNSTCPKTGEKLTSNELVPNTTLRKLIRQFCADNGISMVTSGMKNSDISRTILPGSAAAGEAIKKLSRFLARRLVFGANEQKNKAAYEIRLLAKSSIFNRSCLINAGAILPLLNLLTTPDPMTQENAMAALLKLSKHTSGKKLIVECSGLGSIVSVLKSGRSLESRQIAAAAVFYLSSVRGFRRIIGEIPDAIPGLVDLIREGKACGKKNAIVAIFGLLLYHENHQRVLEAGAVPLLVNILACSNKPELITDSLAVLSSLAEKKEGANAILETPVLPLLIGFLQSSDSMSKAGKEHTVSILLSMCMNCGEDVVAVLARDHALISSVYALTTDGTSPARKKAQSLIRILLAFSEAKNLGFRCAASSHDQFGRVS